MDIKSQNHNLVETYIQQCQKNGTPDEITELMKRPGMTLMHCMQIKFGYEDGLEIKDIREYANPAYSKSECVNVRFQLLRNKERELPTKGIGRCPKCGKKNVMKEVGRTLVSIRDSTERVSRSYYDPQTKTKEYYTDIVDATLLKYDIEEICQYCGYRNHKVYREKHTKV